MSSIKLLTILFCELEKHKFGHKRQFENGTMYAPFDLITRITEAPASDSKYQIFADFMEAEYGYVGVNYGLFLDTRTVRTVQNNFICRRRGLPDEWRSIYQRENYAADDYCLVMGAHTSKPILQSSFYRLLDEDALPTNFAKVVSGVRNFVSSGVVLPLEANGIRGIVGLLDPAGDSTKHDARFERDRPIIQSLANYLHQCTDWSEEVVNQLGLSEMNLRVLQLKAKGLRIKEILHIIERDNPKTVENHMLRLRMKLGTRNDMETVQRAARLGLLKDDGLDNGEPLPTSISALFNQSPG